MKVNYKGFEIEAKREESLGGWDNLYYTVMRTSDGWYMHDGFTTGNDKVGDFVGYLKDDVDDYYQNPSDYKEDELWRKFI